MRCGLIYFVLGLIFYPYTFQCPAQKHILTLFYRKLLGNREMDRLLVINCVFLSWVADTLKYILQNLLWFLIVACPLTAGRPRSNWILVFADSFRFKPVNFLKRRHRSWEPEQFCSNGKLCILKLCGLLIPPLCKYSIK